MKLLRETWFDEGTRLWVTCDTESCLLEVSVKNKKNVELVQVEVLQQAKDSRGLAIGPALVIHRERVRCEVGGSASWLSGRAWLPSRFACPHIRNCYFRITTNPAGV